jgi:hypothetical protein
MGDDVLHDFVGWSSGDGGGAVGLVSDGDVLFDDAFAGGGFDFEGRGGRI